ncbi:aminotransferase class I/II-fold pyridoxal phosphate-dependent enzyme [Oceanospirillaceae bacterium]|jgi:dTDP-4-amino-4,6-dideoxygalactose transaminase|nr:aminotransferase class I/II-fold pyridoxal phosphate-dependent enzyme [Oceanospirillaceae bacterium]MBT6101910.1 aminotransferase class I/II-fold pyridoxal phosphate-dependent enzyme [Oceanospirillaceae bacterium]MBT7674110.1 aminotransferase class I/II-fold pyridoxal phosphate-dependent enzyme [Oceanospirillaceae bacterium]MDB4536920.1 aminotransferase class I/II-fold pyridoxal phosphate-dependent enzyme [Oceanospirillaceae bacterium]MDC0083901.1 aminotransferase class I/II-fold pyridoxal p
MSKLQFTKAFTQQEAIPEQAKQRVMELLDSGRLHRYNTVGNELSDAAMLEQAYAQYQGRKYCLACTSGGYGIHIALRAMGLQAGDEVLTNAYTLAPVPGAIHAAGGKPVLVEIDENYHLDLADLKAKAKASKAKILLLSLMRGHIPNMQQLMTLCNELGIKVLEDCAHTMGASWDGIKSGNFGQVAAFSLQTYKHLNTGEGGLVVTDDAQIAARLIMHSGSYMLYERHGAAPAPEVFENIRLVSANMSGRMDNMRAALGLAQLPNLDKNCERWNHRYNLLNAAIGAISGVDIPTRDKRESFVGSSIQFRPTALKMDQMPDFIAACAAQGVELKWFGESQPKAFTSRYDSWHYISPMPHLPSTLEALDRTLDLRVPLTFDDEDCRLIGAVIAQVMAEFMAH